MSDLRRWQLEQHFMIMVQIASPTPSNEITGANAGERLGLAVKSRVGLSPRPGVAQFRRSAVFAHSVDRESFRCCPLFAVLAFFAVSRFVFAAENAESTESFCSQRRRGAFVAVG